MDRRFDLYRLELNAGRPEELLVRTGHMTFPGDWAPNDRAIVYHRYFGDRPSADLELRELDSGNSRTLAAPEASEYEPEFSYDGRWLAYVTETASGRTEVFVEPYPATGRKFQVSYGGGAQPQWRADGQELFYLRRDAEGASATVMVVRLSARAGTITSDTPRALFTVPVRRGDPPPIRDYVVTPDGQRFLIDTLVRPTSPAPISVLVGWRPRLVR